MAEPYSLTPEAREQLLEIWDYSCDMWGADQADRYYQNLERDFVALALGRKSGKKCGEIYPGATSELLFYLSGRHYVIYRFEKLPRIIIVAVIHGSSYRRLLRALKSGS